MKIKVLFFAALRERARTSEIELDVEGNSVTDALQALEQRFPDLTPWLQAGRVHIAVNDEYVKSDTPLRENDTLALIPPVSGGCL